MEEKVVKKTKKLVSRLFTVWDAQINLEGKQVVWEQISMNGVRKSVMILPILKDGRFVLIKKFLPATNTHGLVLPGGKVEGGLSLIKTAHKELVEEIGFKARRMQAIGPFEILPAYLAVTTYGFVASDLTPDTSHVGDELEKIAKVYLSKREILDAIKAKTIRDARTVALFLYYVTFFQTKVA